MRVTIGQRTVVAATCLSCGQLKDGWHFGWRIRRDNQHRPYIDRRCKKCRWRRAEQSEGR